MKYNIKNITSFLLISILPQLSGFILLKVFTEHLTKEEYGLYSAFMAIPPLMSIFLSLQLHSSISRFYFDCEGEGRKSLIGSILLSVLALSTIGTVLLLLLQTPLLQLLFGEEFESYGSEFSIIILISYVVTVISSLNSILVVTENGHKVLKRIAFTTLLLIVIQYFSVSHFDGDVFSILLVLLVLSILNLFLVAVQTKNYWDMSFDFSVINEAIKYSSPLVFHQLGGYLFNFSSVLVLTSRLTLSDVAMFAILFKLSSLLKIAVNSVNTAWQPTAFKKLRENRKEGLAYIKSSSSDFTNFFIPVYIILSLAVSLIIIFLLPEDYIALAKYVPLALGAYLFRLVYCFNTTLLFFDKKTMLIPKVTLVAGALNLAGVYMLCVYLGYLAAIYSFIASLIFLAVFFTVYNKVVYGMTGELFNLAKVLVVVFVTCFATFLVSVEFVWIVYLVFLFFCTSLLLNAKRRAVLLNFFGGFIGKGV